MAGRLASSIFVGFALESLLYGAFIVIFIAAAVTQWERWKHEKLRTGNKLVTCFSILLLGFISTHWILNFWRCYDVFLSGSDLSAIDDAFGNQRNGTNLARFIVYEVQAWMGDCLLIYRLYHVCGRRWRIVAIPCAMCTTLVACGLCLLKTTVNLNYLDPESTRPFRTWAIVCFTLTFGENLYCLAAIAFFIWRAQVDIRYVTTSPLTVSGSDNTGLAVCLTSTGGSLDIYRVRGNVAFVRQPHIFRVCRRPNGFFGFCIHYQPHARNIFLLDGHSIKSAFPETESSFIRVRCEELGS